MQNVVVFPSVSNNALANPWAAFAENHEKGEQVKGKIKSITDFGIFLELDGGIDGLIYLSDIAWSETEAQETLRKYQKGDELEAVILAIDVERERIALGLKQLAEDPLANYLNENEKGTVVLVKLLKLTRNTLLSNSLKVFVACCAHLKFLLKK